MLEVLQNFEKIVLDLPSFVLISAGLSCLGVGLFVWLGGMRWRIFTAIVFGIVAGLLCVSFVTMNMLVVFIFPALLVTLSILIFKRRGLVLIGGVTTTVVMLLSLATPASANMTYHPATKIPAGIDRSVNLERVVSQITSQSGIMGGKISTVIGDLSPMAIGVAASSGSLVMGIGFFLHRVVSAATCAALGTALIYVGMILLLVNKGSMPAQDICRKPIFYQTVAICMLFFGTFVGRLVCPLRKKKINTIKEECGVEK